MTACIIVAGALQCIVSSTPALPPAEAAKILEPGRYVYVDTSRTEPHVVDGAIAQPQDGPYGPLTFQRLTEPRRLDGSLVSDPPWFTWTYVGGSHHGERRPVRGRR